MQNGVVRNQGTMVLFGRTVHLPILCTYNRSPQTACSTNASPTASTIPYQLMQVCNITVPPTCTSVWHSYHTIPLRLPPPSLTFIRSLRPAFVFLLRRVGCFSGFFCTLRLRDRPFDVRNLVLSLLRSCMAAAE